MEMEEAGRRSPAVGAEGTFWNFGTKFSCEGGSATYDFGRVIPPHPRRGASGHPHETGPAQARLERAAPAINASAAIWRRLHEESSCFFRVDCIAAVVHTCGTSTTDIAGDADVHSDGHADSADAYERRDDFGGA